MQNIQEWLESLGLAQYVSAFEHNAIDSTLLPELNDQVLKDIGIALAGHRLKILSAARAWASSAPAAQAPVTPTVVREAPSPTEGERRQLTVLFCDLVGFTEMANRLDPEILQGIIRAYEDACAACITRYEGYVFQRLGDGIVAFFGYPLAHEGEAERAIHAGLAILASLSKLHVPEAGQLRVRIGIATGVVVVSSLEKGAVGETMNLASRLQGMAAVNTLVVSAQVHHLAAGAFDYEDLGEHALKGIASATRAYRVIGMSQAQTRFDAAQREGQLTPLVGREQEMGLLLERWQLAREGEGQIVLLSGEAGIGKSRILSALRNRLEKAGAHALRFQCSPYHANSAYHPLSNHLERVLGFDSTDSPEAKLDKLEAHLVKDHHRPSTDARLLGAVLSLPVEQRYGPLQMTPQKQKDETLRALVDMMEAVATRRPAVMLFEDLHWADPTTLEVLGLLVDRVRAIPLLSVFTHRPEFTHSWASHGHAISLNLSKLSKAQSTSMVQGIAKNKALPSGLLEKILSRTDGIPLFVEELTKAILESKALQEREDRYEYKGDPAKLIIPATLRDSLMARLDRKQIMKEVAQMGAVIGREFSHELIAAVASLTPSQLSSALNQLTDSGLAHRRGTPPEAVYTFKHALVQDAAYDSLLKSKRQELHRKIAGVIKDKFPHLLDIEPEILAHHLTAAGDAEAAIPLWERAGQSRLERMALAEAISHINSGLALIATLPPSPQRDSSELNLRTMLGTAWMALKGWASPEVWDSFYPALPLARASNDSESLLRVLLGLCLNVLTTGRVADSQRWSDELIAAANATGNEDQLITGIWSSACASYWRGDIGTSRALTERLLHIYDEGKHSHLVHVINHDGKSTAHVYLAWTLWILGYPDQARQTYEDGCDHARRLGHPFDLCYVLGCGVDLYAYCRDPEEVLKRLPEVERLAKEHGLPFVTGLVAPMRRGTAWIRQGRLVEGSDALAPALALWDQSGGKIERPKWRAILAEAAALGGDIEKGLNMLDEGIGQVERPGWEERYYFAEILRLKGWMLSLKGDAQGAERHFCASLDCARAQQAKSWELRTATSLAHLWHDQGKSQQAHDLLAPIYDWFTEGFDTHDLKEAKALLEALRVLR